MRLLSDSKKTLNGSRRDYYKIYLALAVVFCIFFLCTAYCYYHLDHLSLHRTDSTKHLLGAYLMYKNWGRLGLAEPFIKYSYYYPPFVYYITVLVFAVTGPAVHVAVYSQWIFWLLMVLGVFHLCRETANAEAGFIGALLILSIPSLERTATLYFLDPPLVAMTVLSIFFLVKSDLFRRSIWSYGFFTVFALGMLTKRMFPVYVAPALVIALVQALKGVKNEKGIKKGDVFALITPLAAIPTAFITANVLTSRFPIWAGMSGHWPGVLNYFTSILPLVGGFVVIGRIKDKSGIAERIANGLLISAIMVWHVYGMNCWEMLDQAYQMAVVGGRPENILHYIDFIATRSFGIPLTVYTAVGIVVYLLQKNKTQKELLIFWSLVTTGLIIYALPAIDSRYLLPLAAFMIPLSAKWIQGVKNKFAKAAVIVVVFYLCLVGMAGWIFIDTPFYVKTLNKIDRYWSIKHTPPSKRGYAIADLADIIKKMGGNRKVFLASLSNTRHVTVTIGRGLQVEMLYRHGKYYQYCHQFGFARRTPSGKLVQERIKTNDYTFLSETPANPNPSAYDCVIAVQADDGRDLVIVTSGLRKMMRVNGLSHRPDLVINPGQFPGFKKRQMSARIVRIPVRALPITFLKGADPGMKNDRTNSKRHWNEN